MTDNGAELAGGRLTEDAVAVSLATYLGTPVNRVTALAGFVGNQNFLVHTAGADYVLKAGDAVSLAAEAWACDRVRSAGVPAPEVHALELDSRVLPRPFMLMRRLPGGPSEEGSPALAEAGRLLRIVHSLPASGFGFMQKARGDSPTPRGPHETWVEFTSEPLHCLGELVANQIIGGDLADRLRGAFEEHQHAVAYNAEGKLLHGDLHPRHVFAHDGVLTCIIDWGDVAAGDPLFDLGRFSRAAPESLAMLLDGYGLELTAELALTLKMYRLIWSTLVLREELRAGGDWFAAHREAIEADLAEVA